jgi:hypothetical protein
MRSSGQGERGMLGSRFDAAAWFDDAEEHLVDPLLLRQVPFLTSASMSSGRHCNDENNGAEPVIAGCVATCHGATKDGSARKPLAQSRQKDSPSQPERTTTKTASGEELLGSGAVDPDQWLRVCDARQMIRHGNDLIREGKRLVREGKRKDLDIERELQVERELGDADRTRESKIVLSVIDDDSTNFHSNAKAANAVRGGITEGAALLEDDFTRQLRLVGPPDGMSPLDINAFSCITVRHAKVHTEAARSACAIDARGLTTTFDAALVGPPEAESESSTTESLRVLDDEIGTTVSFDFGLSPTTTCFSPSNASEQATAGSVATLDSNQASPFSPNPSFLRIPMVAPGGIGILTFSPFSELNFSETSRVSWGSPSHEEEGDASTETSGSPENAQRT